MTAPMSEPTVSEERVEALASILDRHVTDAAFEAGCRLSCGYDGDDLTEHIAQALLASPAMRDLLAEVWDEGWVTGMGDAAGLMNGTQAAVSANPYRTEQR